MYKRQAGKGGRGERVILVRLETSPEDIEGMHASQGILTVRGGMTSVSYTHLGREWCRKNHSDEGSYNRFKTNGRNGFT